MEKINTIQKREKLNLVYRMDQAGPGGAYHNYAIQPQNINNPTTMSIIFQKGPRNVIGSQCGVIDTDLLEIVRDRMKCFQDGEFATDNNQKALEHIEIALMYLNRRVEDRIERDVLGTYEK